MRMTKVRETMAALDEKNTTIVKENKAHKICRNIYAATMAASAMIGATGAVAFADGGGSLDSDGNNIMKNIISLLFTISKYVGMALIIYGVYEIVMSFMQQQPEAKTKGIVMALCGAAMTMLQELCKLVGVSIS